MKAVNVVQFEVETGDMRRDGNNGPTWIRTRNQGIMSPVEDGENLGFSDTSPEPSAVDTAVGREIDADLRRVLDAWPSLPETVRADILAMIDAALLNGNRDRRRGRRAKGRQQ